MPLSADSRMFEAMVGKFSAGLYVVQDGRAIFLNRHFGEIFGYHDLESLIGRSLFEDIYPDRQSVGLFRQIHERMLAENLPEVSWAQVAVRRDGTPFWLEIEARQIQIQGGPAILGIFKDQTECQLIAKAMLASQETLRMVLDAMEDRVYVVTDEYRVVYANRKMMESIVGDIKTDPCYRLCRGLEEACPDCSKDKVFTSDQPVYKEFFNERSQGWYSVVELAIRMPGIDRPTKLAVARDITSRKNAEQRNRALTHRLLSAQENERRHLSRDLHDDVGQRLNAVKIGLETLAEDLGRQDRDVLPRFGSLSQILQGCIESVRDLSAGLRPASLERLGLVETIRHHCRKISLVNGLRIDFKSAGMAGLKLDSDVEINLYRVVQEALHNVVKHAQASEVSIRLVSSFPNLRLRIEDDGRGFEISHLQTEGGHLGLVGMAERADLLNGRFEIRSRPGQGTCIVLEVPLTRRAVDCG